MIGGMIKTIILYHVSLFESLYFDGLSCSGLHIEENGRQ